MFTTDATRLHRVMNCNGSVNMPASFPDAGVDDPTARDEGNAAHWYAQQWFNNGDAHGRSLIGTKAFNGVIVTAEMAEYVAEYLSGIEVCGEMEAVTTFGNDRWQVNARCDHWALCEVTDTLYVDDFKYGRTLIDVIGNWALLAHAIGLCILHGVQPRNIILRIHQPRPYHPDGKMREWRLSYTELTGYYQQIDATLSNLRNELRTGLEWCARCHALATCPAARGARMNIIDATSTTFSDEMPNDALGYELDTLRTAKKMLEAQVSALEELATHRLKTGQVIDNYALDNQYAHRRFKAGFDYEFLTAATGVDCSTKPGTITPAEAERRGINAAAIAALTERPLTGTKLVRVSADKRAQRLLGKKG